MLIASFYKGPFYFEDIQKQLNTFIEVEVPKKVYDRVISNEGDDWPRCNLWMQEECKGNVLVMWEQPYVWFENPSDAVYFKMIWMNPEGID